MLNTPVKSYLSSSTVIFFFKFVIIEIVFNIEAMGQLILDGVTRNDVYLVQGVTLTVAIAFIVVNILVDVLYVLVNPRIRSI